MTNIKNSAEITQFNAVAVYASDDACFLIESAPMAVPIRHEMPQKYMPLNSEVNIPPEYSVALAIISPPIGLIRNIIRDMYFMKTFCISAAERQRSGDSPLVASTQQRLVRLCLSFSFRGKIEWVGSRGYGDVKNPNYAKGQ